MKTKNFKSGNYLAVSFPKAFELSRGSGSIYRDGSGIIRDELTEIGWPMGLSIN